MQKDYYQSTIPETIQIGNRTYVTLDLINQARKSYSESRKLINRSTGKTRKQHNDNFNGAPRYTEEDAKFCATHDIPEIMAKWSISRPRAYQLRGYLMTRFGVPLIKI